MAFRPTRVLKALAGTNQAPIIPPASHGDAVELAQHVALPADFVPQNDRSPHHMKQDPKPAV